MSHLDVLFYEGDWEMMRIICDNNRNSQKVGYSWHYEMKKSGWDSGDLRKDGDNPKVYVEEDGHSSNFEPGTTESESDYTTTLTDDDYTINMLSNQDWLNFRGDWGKDGGSVPGAFFRYTKHSAAVWRHSKPYLLGATSDYWYRPEADMWIEPIYWSSILN